MWRLAVRYDIYIYDIRLQRVKRRLKGNNYPKEIRELIAEKRETRRRWQQTRAPQVKTELNNLTQLLKREIKELYI
jgi:non-homologous end joining protein Ku